MLFRYGMVLTGIATLLVGIPVYVLYHAVKRNVDATHPLGDRLIIAAGMAVAAILMIAAIPDSYEIAEENFRNGDYRLAARAYDSVDPGHAHYADARLGKIAAEAMTEWEQAQLSIAAGPPRPRRPPIGAVRPPSGRRREPAMPVLPERPATLTVGMTYRLHSLERRVWMHSARDSWSPPYLIDALRNGNSAKLLEVAYRNGSDRCRVSVLGRTEGWVMCDHLVLEDGDGA